MRALQGVARTHGPLSCKSVDRACLSAGRGQWYCDAQQVLGAPEHTVLRSLWAASAHAVRNFVVHARLKRMASLPSGRAGTIKISGEWTPSRVPETDVRLAACTVEPLRPQEEIARLLACQSSHQ